MMIDFEMALVPSSVMKTDSVFSTVSLIIRNHALIGACLTICKLLLQNQHLVVCKKIFSGAWKLSSYHYI